MKRGVYMYDNIMNIISKFFLAVVLGVVFGLCIYLVIKLIVEFI